jgi:type I restriction enzyme M protein
MGRKKLNRKPAKSFEETLWDSANKLRGSVEPAEYKHVVLSLIFLKFSSDKFEERRQEIIDEGKAKFVDMVEFYTMKNVFYLPEESRWSYIQANAKQDDLALKIDTALHTIEKNNKSLAGALPDNYFSRLDLDRSKLAALIDTISNINTLADKSQDVVGRVYEYFLSKFALAEGKGKGEFYTPKSIVNLIAELIEPYKGKIYDPCCGSGGMFVQSVKFVESHRGNTKNVSIYGQEGTTTTMKLAKMNLAIRGISGNLGVKADDTFANDQHPNLKADYIMANPPFNLKDWRASDELVDDPRWAGYEVPPTGNANYAWILHILSKLSAKGVAGFVLANSSLSADDAEYEIRKKIISNGFLEAILVLPRDMFYTTNISVAIWILNKDKSGSGNLRPREDEVLFIDLRQMGSKYEKKYIVLSDEERVRVTNTFHAWRSKEGGYKDEPEFCRSSKLSEIVQNDYSLLPNRYIEFRQQSKDIDYEKEYKEIGKTIDSLIVEQRQSDVLITKLMEELTGGQYE